MKKQMLFILLLQLLKVDFGNSYRPAMQSRYQKYSEEEDDYQRQEKMDYNMRRNMNNNNRRYVDFRYNDVEESEEDYSNDVDPNSVNSMFEEAAEIISMIKSKITEEYKRITTLDQQNQEKAKGTLADTREEIDNRVGYLRQLLHKKREEAVGPNASVMRCVVDSLNKLARVTPELMKEEEQCIWSELEMSRAVSKVTLDLLKENLHAIKIYQERLNKCQSSYNRNNLCLVSVLGDLSNFKKNVKVAVPAKMAETISFLTRHAGRMRTCSIAQVRKVVNRAGEIIVKFNNCVKNLDYGYGRKKKTELLLFVV